VGMGDDYESFCSCYANRFARTFGDNPSMGRRDQERMMTDAMNGCNMERGYRQRQAQAEMTQDIKRSGWFDLLFPGATPLKPETPPHRLDDAIPPGQPVQPRPYRP